MIFGRPWIIVFAICTTGCRWSSPANDPAGSVVIAGRSDRVRVEVSPELDVGDLPRVMAVEVMRARGHVVEMVKLADTNATILALERGDLDFANVSDVTGWAAIQNGARIVAVMDDSVNPIVVVARAAITRCRDLHGRRVGIGALTSTRTVMLNHYLQQRCPGTKPAYLVIGGESTRIAGLLSGELDAGLIDLGNLAAIGRSHPGVLLPLVEFAAEYPGLTINSQFARREMTERYPDTVRAWLRAVLEARRELQDPRVFADQLMKRMGVAPDLAAQVAALHLERRFWDVNGRYTLELVQRNLDFAVEAAGIKPVEASAVADLSFLNAVLDEIGRK